MAEPILVWGDGPYTSGYGLTNLPVFPTNVLTLTGGDYHGVALLADGTVGAWGSNTYGQTNVPASITNVVSLGAGSTYSVAIQENGSLQMWGRSQYAAIDITPPETNGFAAAGLGTGAEHGLALRTNGTVLDWGTSSPLQYAALLTNFPATATNLVSVAAGANHIVALRGDGRVIAWGDNSSGQVNVPANLTNAVAIAAGWNHSAALRANGTIVAWGEVSWSPNPGLNNFVDVACGAVHTLGLRRDGTVMALGDNAQHGHSLTVPASATNLVSVSGISFLSLGLVGSGAPHFTARPIPRVVASGATAYLRLTAVGARPLSYRWSFNSLSIPNATNSFLAVTNVQPSQAGNYTLTVSNALGMITNASISLTVLPVVIMTQPVSQAAYSGAAVTLSVGAEGQGPLSYQWQLNGQDIVGATNSSLVFSSVQETNAGSYTVIVSNQYGQATSTAAVVSVSPILITGQPVDRVVFRGGETTLSVAAQSSQPISYQWKFNDVDLLGADSNTLTLSDLDYGDTGDYSVALSNSLAIIGSASARLTVVPIATWGQDTNTPAQLTNVLAVSAGSAMNLALKPDGTVVAWNDRYGTIGEVPPEVTNIVSVSAGWGNYLALREDGTVVAWNATGVHTNVPPAVTNVVAISAGYFFTALKADGTVISWGNPNQGMTNVPPGLDNVVAIDSREAHGLALLSDGQVVGWGFNGSGQTNVPSSLSNVIAIAAGGAHSMALRSDRTVVVWGSGNYGQTNVPALATNVVAISAGESHCVALRADGTVIAWGYSWSGVTAVPASLRNVTTISAGVQASLALVGDTPLPSQIELDQVSWSNNSFSVSMPTQSGRVYRLEYKKSLTDAQWTPLPLIAGNGKTRVLTDPGAHESQRFYRVRQW